MKKPAVLYVSYSGMLEPLGSSQVLGYLERLSQQYQIHLISFEKPADLDDRKRFEELKAWIAKCSIHWTPLRYHRTPPALAKSYDIAIGMIIALRLAWKHDIKIVHCRSYVASVIGLAVKRICGARFIFDMRGFWADERVDGRIWKPGSPILKLAKLLERRFFSAADCIVSLTETGANEIRNLGYFGDHAPDIAVIPTCANFDFFRPAGGQKRECFTLGYVGSASTWHLFEDFLSFFSALKKMRPNSKLLILNRGEHEYISDKLSESNISDEDVEIRAVEHKQVPNYISQMTAGTAFYKSTERSNIARSPTKLAEYLGCGVPCVGTAGVGDMDSILERDQVGVVLSEFSDVAMQRAITELIDLVEAPDIAERCVEAARKRFSIDHGVSKYSAIYGRLSEA